MEKNVESTEIIKLCQCVLFITEIAIEKTANTPKCTIAIDENLSKI